MRLAFWRSVAAFSLFLVVVTGCELQPTDNVALTRGQEALAAHDFQRALEISTRVISDAAAAPQPHVVVKRAHLLRGECRLAVARASFTLIPTPLSGSPIKVVPIIDSTAEPEVSLRAIAEDLDKVLDDDGDEFSPDRLKAIRLLGETLELYGKDTDAAARYTVLSDLSSGRDLELYCLANTRLGWLSLKPLLSGSDETFFRAEIQKKLRTAIRHFENVLNACADDQDALLGKGVALIELGQAEEGFGVLKHFNDVASRGDEPSPIAHLYLARAIENEQGYQSEALDHLVSAMGNDPQRKYYPIYAAIVRTLPRYLSSGNPQFHEIARTLLAYRGLEPTYWTEVERLCEQLGADDNFPRPLASLGLATARIRIGKIDQAIESLLTLRGESDFYELMEPAIPQNSASPEMIYARLSVLFELGEHELIEEIAKGGVPVDPISSYYFRIQGVFALNLFARWNQLVAAKPEFLQNRYIQEHYLLNARRKLSRFLRRFPDHVAARRGLGEILQMTGDLSAALSHYCDAAALAPNDVETFQRLVEIHRSEGLDSEDRLRAWKCLKTFSGATPALRRYVQSVRSANLSKAKRSCPGCGGDPESGATVCVVCGTKLPSLAAERAPSRRPAR